jgi:O-antigen/teichoic acid export membrane protein
VSHGEARDVTWRSNLKLKLLASYFGQTYVALVGVIIAPLYVRYLGTDGYGLIGVFTLLQSWMALLDLGFSATLARETARYGAGSVAPAEFRHLVNVLGRVFLASGLAFAALGVVAAPWLSRHWLKTGGLDLREVTLALAVMAVTVAIRWRTEPFRSILVGLERLVWLNAFNSIVATFRFVGAVAVLIFVQRSIAAFFIYQLLIAVIEWAVIVFEAQRIMPGDKLPEAERKRMWPTLRPLFRFSLGVAFSSAIWLFISQFDKVLLSTLLPLKTYGVFALATLAAGGVSLLSGPVSQVVLPRLTALNAKAEDEALRRIYRQATAFITALVAPASLILALFGGEILWVWTGDRTLAAQAAPILRWYALGNGLLALTAFSYYLQYAHGDLRLHVRGNAVFALVLTPAVVFAALRYGGVGTGIVWFAANLAYLFGWTFFVHGRFAPGLHWRWLGRDIALVALPAAAILTAVRLGALPWYENRVMNLIVLMLAGGLALAASAALVPGVPANALALARRLRRTAL